MKIIKKKVKDLIRPDFNPRIDVRTNKSLYEKLEKSIDEFGYVSPVIYNKQTGNVVGGNQRLAILEDKGITEIDVVEIDISLNKEKSLNVALNKISGDWDNDKLATLLNDIKPDDLDVLTGFDTDEIDTLLIDAGLIEPSEEKTDLDKLIEGESKYDVQRGDIYQLGSHRVMCGDCTDTGDVQSLLNDNKAGLLLTDPPYNVDYSSKNQFLNQHDEGNRIQIPIIKDSMNEQAYQDFITKWMEAALNIITDYNSIYIFGNSDSLFPYYNINALKLSCMLVWKKNNIVIGRMDYKCQHEFILYGWKTHHKWYGPNNASTVIEFNKPLSSKLHPTMKPVPLLTRLIYNSSKKDDNVYDPFGGSGSTLIACEQTKRNCYTIEIDPHYCSVIIERWEKYTGDKHKKINIETSLILS